MKRFLPRLGIMTAMGKVLKELREPRPAGGSCIPWLGETEMKERMIRLCARGKITINVRGGNLLQANPGESDEAAWRRMRASLGYTGRQLDEVLLLMPSASPTSGGSGIETTPVTTATGTGNGRIEPAGGLWDTPSSQPGSKEPPQQAQTAKPRISLIKERTSALNHIGQLEAWGIGPATPVVNVNLKISSATGAQLKDILKKLPDGLTFDLSLEQEES